MFKSWDYYDKLEKIHIKLIELYTNKKCTYITEGYNPDYDCIINDKTIEIKTDLQANNYGNVCIEFENINQNKPSGIAITKADIWSNTYYHDNNWYIGLCKTETLKPYVENNHSRIVTNKRSGDNNAKLYLITGKQYHEQCIIHFKIKNPNNWL
jgi:hypothetical protein